MISKLINLFSRKKTPAELVRLRKVSNLESQGDMMSGVIRQYQQMNNKQMANQILKESIEPLKKAKFK
ncbi:gp95 [Bacillus phage G]|uniref:Gp95 n=1 Tax=Bacillus phage G TaxID=2884420 RepID=G3MBF9_9CAUD|nr:gp95 [Bacillus phage G]AEO93359.1 gp95 [Bacillus phage G]